MSILTKNVILDKINKGEIIISPLDKKVIGPASIDLHLGNQFRIFKKTNKIHHISSQLNINDITELILKNDYFVLSLGQSVLGITLEKITLPDNICGWIEGKSTLGRLGLAVHVTAGFIHPGVSNKQVLEMYNTGPLELALNIGAPICQIILEETRGSAKYQGKFYGQEIP